MFNFWLKDDSYINSLMPKNAYKHVTVNCGTNGSVNHGITWNTADMLSVGALGKNFNEIWIAT